MGKEPGPHWGGVPAVAPPGLALATRRSGCKARLVAPPAVRPIAPVAPATSPEPSSETAGARVTRGALLLTLMQPLTWAATLAFVALVPHFLGARGFGAFAVTANAAMIVGALVSLGVPTYLTRQLAAAPDDTEALSAALLLAIVGGAIAALLLSQLYALTGAGPHDLLLARLALAGMAVSAGQSVLFSALNGRGRHGRYALLSTLLSLAVIGAQLVVLTLGGGVTGMFSAGLVVASAVFVLTWLLAGCPHGRVRPRALWRVATGSLPFFAWDVVLRVRMQIDIVLVQLLAQATAAGHLAAAYQIVGIPIFIPTAIVTPLLPALSDPRVDRDAFRSTLQHSLLAVLILTAPLSAGIAALAPAIPHLLHWPGDLGGAVLAMRLLVPEPPLIAADMVLGTAVVALRRERAWLLAAVAAATFNILGNAIAIPLLGHALGNAAAAAALIEDGTELLMLGAALALIPHDLLAPRLLWQAARVLLAAGLVAVVAALLAGHSLPLAIGAGAVVYACALPALGVLRPADLRAVSALIAPRIGGRLRRLRGTTAPIAVDNSKSEHQPAPPQIALRYGWQPPRGGSAAARAAALLRVAGGLD
jgi:O-antigen/teichoic acid export membrane protein